MEEMFYYDINEYQTDKEIINALKKCDAKKKKANECKDLVRNQIKAEEEITKKNNPINNKNLLNFILII